MLNKEVDAVIKPLKNNKFQKLLTVEMLNYGGEKLKN